MKNYVYKIQWLLKPKEAIKVIKIIGARSLTKICLRNMDLDIVDIYTGMVSYPSGVSEFETAKYIRKQAKKNPQIWYVELYRTN